MATKKKTTKKPAAKKAAKKAGKKAAPAKKAAAPAKKKAAAPAKKAAAGKKKAAPAKKKAASSDSKAAPAKKPAGKGEFSAESVTLGRLFALRPRVNTSFPPAEFMKAKRALSDERDGSVEEAARAVAERALEDSNKKPGKHKVGHRR